MANISKIQVDGTTYDIEDTVARSRGGGLSADVKQALLACFEKVAWIDANGQTYYDDLEAALYPPANLSYITAVYTQSGTVYTTDTLDSLKPDLVVTAHYTNAASEVITNYTLSGTLAEGTSTITVTYGGKTTTFNVTVTLHIIKSYYITFANETASSGYIGNDGTVVSSNTNYYIDKFYEARPFTLTLADGTDFVPKIATKRLAEYDSSYAFLGRSYDNTNYVISLQNNGTYTKVGWQNDANTPANPKYIIGFDTIESALFTNSNKVLDTDGNLTTQSGHSTTDYIEVSSKCDKFFLRFTGTDTDSTIRIAFYDSSKTFISRYVNADSSSSATKTPIGDVPSNAKYFRFDKADSVTGYYPLAEEV